MKVLVVGKGGREHALIWKIAQSPKVETIFAAPGSPGIATLATCLTDLRLDKPASDPEGLLAEIDRLVDFVREEGIDLTVVGPEDPLSVGIVDRLEAGGHKVFGPTAAAARLESDKTFSKDLMVRLGVPTAAHRSFDNSDEARAYIRATGAPVVIKAAGLAAGKGVTVAATVEEALAAVDRIMDQSIFGDAGAQVVIEQFLEGEEASVFAITDGGDFVTLITAQDHKPIGEGDVGPNTGGMGAYAPAPVMTPELVRAAEDEVIRPVLAEMRRQGTPFRGVLFVGLIITDKGPMVIEFNCRFGDPEAQVVLPLLACDLVELMEAAADGAISRVANVPVSAGAAVCVVLASHGYPGAYRTGKDIKGLDYFNGRDDQTAFHSGTTMKGGSIATDGGRVLGVTALGEDIPSALARAYEAVDKVSFEGKLYRRDIAHRAMARLGLPIAHRGKSK